jgi:hypothetical protein
MTECGRAIRLCKSREYVCQKLFLIFQILEDLWLVVYELEESFFVCF